MVTHSEMEGQEQYRHMVQGPEPHSLPIWLYWLIFGILVALTVITVSLADYDLASYAMLVTLLIAGTKATLVISVFMHVWYDNKFYFLIIATSLLFLSLFILFPILDLGSRARVDPIKGNFLPRNEAVYQHQLQQPGALPLRPGLKDAVKDELIFIGPDSHH